MKFDVISHEKLEKKITSNATVKGIHLKRSYILKAYRSSKAKSMNHDDLSPFPRNDILVCCM
jgi:hypothetical protein